MSNPAAYGLVKGMIQLTKWLATTLAPSVRERHLTRRHIQESASEFLYRYEQKPLKRMATNRHL